MSDDVDSPGTPLQELLFNPSLWMPAALAVVAIGLFIYGNSRLKPPIRNAGLGLFGLMLVWCVAAALVQTRVEKCIARTKSIVAAVEASDWPKLASLLDKTTTLEFLGGADAITHATQTASQSYGLKAIHMFNTEAIEGPGGTVDVTFNSLLEGQQATTATFQFQYEQRSDGILLAKIIPLRIGDKSLDDVRKAIR